MDDADKIGILSNAVEDSKQEDIYVTALHRVNQEIARKESMIDTNFTGRRSEVEKDDLDDYCEDLMNDLEQDVTQMQSGYTCEYEEVISIISHVCNSITQSAKRAETKAIDDELVIELCPRIWGLAVEYQMCTVEEK